MIRLTCFKGYDVRGQLGTELDESIAYRIGRAYAQFLKPSTVVIGADMRLSSEGLKQAVADGLMDEGVDVIDLGMTGTEEIYFSTWHLGLDGGIEITASHNPIDFNGIKFVREQSKPISGDTGLKEIQRLAENIDLSIPVERKGSMTKMNTLKDYVHHLLGYVDINAIRPLRLVVNSGNGAAGHVIDAIEAEFQKSGVPVEFIKVHHQPDGNFPNGIPNPILVENREDTIDAVLSNNADMGIAWDGDFDRCFLFDEKGHFIEGYYIVGLLAEAFLSKDPQQKIIHDPRLIWNTIDIVKKAGGTPVQTKSGHAFIKERMRLEDAVYGGEMSAHHYFRDFAYCDSGMIPWLLVAELLSQKNQPLSAMVEERIKRFPCSGEINFTVQNSGETVEKIRQHYLAEEPKIEDVDGMSMDFGDWRFNLRSSNTEPLLRLNVESDGNEALMHSKTAELSKMITE